MTKQEMVVSMLQGLGYEPQIDNDGDVFVRYEMKCFYVMGTRTEENFLLVWFPEFYEIKEGEETKVLMACNKLTRDLKLAKVNTDQAFKHVSASCEFFYTDEESMKFCLERSFEILSLVRITFIDAFRE